MRTWTGRFAEHSAYVVAWLATAIARFDIQVVIVDLAVGSFSLVVARIACAATKVPLVIVGVVLVVARVLEQCPGNFRTKSGHSHLGSWMNQAECTT